MKVEKKSYNDNNNITNPTKPISLSERHRWSIGSEEIEGIANNNNKRKTFLGLSVFCLLSVSFGE